MLASQVFTTDGKRYVKGSPTTKCSFAYLAQPNISATGDWLQIKARFTGRSALGVLGKCIGLGDSFDVTIYAKPYYKNGMVALKEVSVESVGGDSIYKRRVRQAMAETLPRDFAYPLAVEAKKLLEAPRPGAGFIQLLDDFAATNIRISKEAVVLTLDFKLAVK